MCIAQPTFAATTVGAPVEAMLRSFRSASSVAISGWVRLYVPAAPQQISDSGSGMSPKFIRTRLFKPFHSSKPGGFGIGAFESRELVRAMGGRLDVESRDGLGTRFRLRLPLADTAELIRSMNSDKPEEA